MMHSLGFEEFSRERGWLRWIDWSPVGLAEPLQHFVDELVIFGRRCGTERQADAGELEIEQPPTQGLSPVVGSLGRSERDQFQLATVGR